MLPLISLPTFLLEIGTEELPADFASAAPLQLDQIVRRDLDTHRFTYGEIFSTSTPRRITLLIYDLAVAASDLEQFRKGPPAEQAFKDGLPTKAALGFAKNLGLTTDSLDIQETDKGSFVFAKVLDPGESAQQFLAEKIPQWITSLQGRRFMRWGNGDRRFSRPIRWLVALLDKEVVPVCMDDADPRVLSGNLSRGNRNDQNELVISSANHYLTTLANVGIEVKRKSRKSLIRSEVDKAAANLNALPDLTHDLCEELIDLVETPILIKASIPDKFLDLPTEVLTTVMRSHQRYIPLWRLNAPKDPLSLNAREQVLPSFLFIGNGSKQSEDLVRLGNERVLRARLADAEFFLKADKSVKSIQRVEELKKVTFAKGLGSLFARVDRIQWLTDLIIEHIDLTGPFAEYARRAAYLCKHDLTSQMVGEFPELQGVMGAKYLLEEGEPRQVALAVLEQYLPKGSGDRLPETEAGSLIALAERLELLFSIFSIGERPTGSSDPYALRRAGNGILQIIFSTNWSIDFISLIQKASSYWTEILPDLKLDASALVTELAEFIRQRLFNFFEEVHIDIDIIQSIASEDIHIERILSDPIDVRSRAELLMKMRNSGELAELQAVVIRAAKLADKSHLSLDILDPSNVVNSQLFEKESEMELLNVLNNLNPIIQSGSIDRYFQLAQGLVAGSEKLANFFDGESSVMVMVEDQRIRENRLNLLAVLRNQAFVLADFRKININS